MCKLWNIDIIYEKYSKVNINFENFLQYWYNMWKKLHGLFNIRCKFKMFIEYMKTYCNIYIIYENML